jgi:hypothetical protein
MLYFVEQLNAHVNETFWAYFTTHYRTEVAGVSLG